MSGLTVRERSRLLLLASLRGERWGGVVDESEAELVVRRRRVVVERVVVRRVPGVSVVCGVDACRELVPVGVVRHVVVHADGCPADGLCDPWAGCMVRPVCVSCALRVAGVLV